MLRRVLMLAALGATSCGPPDGPVSWALGLHPVLAAPEKASGRCQADVAAGRVQASAQGLEPGDYLLVVGVGDAPLRPLGSPPARGWRREVVRLVSLDAGTTSPDGALLLSTPGEPGELGRVVAAQLERILPDAGTQLVLRGEVGNLDELAPEPNPVETGGGHHH